MSTTKGVFIKEINGWKAWGNVFQSIGDFRNLIKEIFTKESLSDIEEIANLTPGTNAVFRVGSYVIKIFAPEEAGVNSDADFNAEMQAMQRAIAMGINTPKIIAASSIQDKYLFRYIIMDYIEGEEAGKVLKNYTLNEKIHFVKEINENLKKINICPVEEFNISAFKEKAIKNVRWNQYDTALRRQREDLIIKMDLSQHVYVHGDITAENVLVDKEGKLYIIDFADSTIGPKQYEYPPIIFDLFDFDKELVREFAKELDCNTFIDEIFHGLLLHEFGAHFVKIIYERLTDKEIDKLQNLFEIKYLLDKYFDE